MRIRTRTLLMIGVLAFVATAVLWRLGGARFSVLRGIDTARTESPVPLQSTLSNLVAPRVAVLPASLPAVAGPGTVPALGAGSESKASTERPATLRLTNTDRPVDALSRDDKALVLRNAFIDTASGTPLRIPEHLKAAEEPGAYLVQARSAISPEFQEALRQAGTRFVSYVPVNAYLVAATAAQAERVRQLPLVGAVVPFEPYFKLEPALLDRAVRDEVLGEDQRLTVTLLPGADRDALQSAGARVQSEFVTPFGPGFLVDASGLSLARIARIPEVQGIEMFRQRQLLNDRARAGFGVSAGTNAPGAFTNYLGLTGTNVMVNVNDSGIDETHPDLKGRVKADTPSTLVDFDGHGTHVAATIAGSGSMSATVSNAPGSVIPGADFRGMAPSAELFALPIDLQTGPLISDVYLQQAAATNYYVTLQRTNLLISNNSWGYINAFDYTLASASYDAAVRDALPDVSGAQPIVYVFASGNEGAGADDGQGGEPNTVRAPGTGKNVITVGAIESLREITNEVVSILPDGTFTTNQVFLGETDTDDQITSFSGRGNVEPGIDGRFGRFKPDVVAPGAFTISARSQDWVDPEFFTSVRVNRIERQRVQPGAQVNYSLFVPDQASEFRVRLLRNDQSPDPLPGLPMYLRYGDIPGAADLVNTNNVLRVPPDATVRSGDWFYSVGNFGDRAVSYDIQTMIVITNGNFGYFDELKKLNDGLAPNYRFESGTSMAAPAVSGLLALYQDYFQRERRRITPALLKALLINGARSLGSHYNFSLRDVLNLQGWGGANITNALPAGEFGSSTGSVHAVQFTDQFGTNGITTGKEKTWRVTLAPEALDQILKFTLVWTDPPGNPASGIKLVNDLDLVVRNVATGEEFHGNDIPYRSDFNIPHAAGSTITNDNVNNVENVLIRPPVGTNYLVSVRGRRVNVNAVATHPDGIAQDFALVASVANTRLTNVLDIQLVPEPDPSLVGTPVVRTLTNGLPILRARVGANPPRFGTLPGSSAQWSFFVFTNTQANTPPGVGLTNGQFVAFLTFGALNLAKPREAGADIDLYASTDPTFTNLNPVAVQNALKSTRPGGIETLVLTNATLGTVYYLGVKAEDQQAAEFTIAGLSSNVPFDEDDGQGNRIVRGVPYFVPIPDGSPDEPQAGYVFGIVTTSFNVRQVTVTNTVSFDSTGDLLFNLAHDSTFAVLGNHELDPFGVGGVETTIYDDSGAGVGVGTLVGRVTDGPGSLQNFTGMEAAGAWILTVADNALTQVATNVALTLSIQREPLLEEGFAFTVRPGEWVRSSRRLPDSATNMIIRVTDISSGGSQLEIYTRRTFPPTRIDYDKYAIIPGGATEGSLTLGLGDVPPLNPGIYHAGVYNPGPETVSGRLWIDYEVDPNLSGDQSYAVNAPLPIRDDGVIRASMPVFDDRVLADVRVGIRVDHPRVSDLVFRLISPQGTPLVLAENRGGSNGVAYGAERGASRIFTTFTDDTNRTVTPIKFGTPAFTNSPIASTAPNRILMEDSFEVAPPRIYQAGETIAPGWRVLSGQATVTPLPPGSTNRFDGDQYLVLGSGQSSIGTNLVLTPGSLYRLRFGAGRLATSQPQGIQVYVDGRLVHELKSDALRFGWYQSSFLFGATSSQNLLEFRSMVGGGTRLPLAIDGVIVDEADPAMNSYYLPEERLFPLIGQRALGAWQLEIADTRAGPVATNSGVLVDWRLELDFDTDPVAAVRLTNGVPYFGSVNEDEVQYFYVDTPVCATTSLNILSGELATLLLYGDRDGLPQADLGNFVDDYGPYINVEAGGRATLTLTTNFPASAPLRPGQRYFLAVRNFQPDRPDNPFGIMVQFDCE
ncbi:MAG: S8 family serine peptidase, partial [Limisphaerales bacterium]